MAGNHTNVYAPSQASGFSLSDTIGQQERLNLARKDQQMREQQLEEHRRDKQLARDEKLRERLLKSVEAYDTGSGSLNELQGRIVMKAINRKGEIYNKLRSGNISDSERIKLEMENLNLDNLGTNLKVATQNFTKMNQDYMEGVKNGSLFRNLDFEKKVLNGFENYLGGIDDNGFPMIGFKDLDGDGKIDLMPWDNLKDSIGVWEFQPKLDYDEMISKMSKGLGTVKTKDREGYDIITEKGIPLDVAKTSAQSLMYDSDGALTNFAKSRLTELGYDYKNPSEDVLKGIERDVSERIFNSKDRESFRERDSTAEQGDKNRAQRERHHQDSKTTETTGIGEAVTPTENTWGSHYNEIAKDVKSVPVDGKVKLDAISRKIEKEITKKNSEGKDVKTKTTEDKTYSNVTVNNYTYNKEGNMIISGTYPEGKITKTLGDWESNEKVSSTENKKINITVSKETESRIAKMLNTTTEELKQRANFTKQNMSTSKSDSNSSQKETIEW